MQAKNPVLPGCYPDPSICRVGDDYYLVNSTFEYLPGLPVFHSKDLVHWEQIGHVIDREGMLDFDGVKSSGGLFAPTIRFNPRNGKFYIVCTLVDDGVNQKAGKPAGNFVVTADNPAGPWSDPIWLDKPGIDPSLFFDDDGKVWLHGTRLAEPGEWFHQTEVWLQELDPETLLTKGEEYILWNGAVRGAVWTEGPHIYRIGDYYYLLTAEGGTEFHHAVCIARAKNITGPYEGNKVNPIFTHRTLGRHFPIMGVGHADLVPAGAASCTDRDAGPWYAVLLGMQLYGGYHYNLGRETFLVPVTWEDDWPVFAIGSGRIEPVVEVPDVVGAGTAAGPGATTPWPALAAGPLIPPADLRWSALRALPTTVAEPAGDGWRLPVRPDTLTERGTPAFLGIRQGQQFFNFTAKLDVADLKPGEWAGAVVRQSESDYATVLATPVASHDGAAPQYQVKTQVFVKGTPLTVASNVITSPSPVLTFEIQVHDGAQPDHPVPADLPASQAYRCTVIASDGTRTPVGIIDGRTLDTAAAGGFLGLWLGVYATSEGHPTNSAITTQVSYQGA